MDRSPQRAWPVAGEWCETEATHRAARLVARVTPDRAGARSHSASRGVRLELTQRAPRGKAAEAPFQAAGQRPGGRVFPQHSRRPGGFYRTASLGAQETTRLRSAGPAPARLLRSYIAFCVGGAAYGHPMDGTLKSN